MLFVDWVHLSRSLMLLFLCHAFQRGCLLLLRVSAPFSRACNLSVQGEGKHHNDRFFRQKLCNQIIQTTDKIFLFSFHLEDCWLSLPYIVEITLILYQTVTRLAWARQPARVYLMSPHWGWLAYANKIMINFVNTFITRVLIGTPSKKINWSLKWKRLGRKKLDECIEVA